MNCPGLYALLIGVALRAVLAPDAFACAAEDPQLRYVRLSTELHDAVKRGATAEEVIDLISQGADPNYGIGSNGGVPLHTAASSGRPDIVKILLDAGALVDARSANGWTPLLPAAACFNQQRAEVLRLLLDAGADAQVVTDKGWTTLLELAFSCSGPKLDKACAESGLKALISAGADLNVTEKASGAAPLHIAAFRGELFIVRHLVEAGADVNLKDKDGRTPLDFAKKQKHDDVIAYLTEAERKARQPGGATTRKSGTATRPSAAPHHSSPRPSRTLTRLPDAPPTKSQD
jgi:hypothetical protein